MITCLRKNCKPENRKIDLLYQITGLVRKVIFSAINYNFDQMIQQIHYAT